MSIRHSASLLLVVGLLVSLVSGSAASARPLFVPDAITPAGTHVADFAVGDFNNDGKADVGIVSLGYKLKTAVVLVGRGGGAFGPASAPVKLSEAPVRILTADVNGDGDLDAAVLQNDEPEVAATHVSILLGNGAGALRRASISPIQFGELAAISDVNGDHKPDLIGFDDDRVAVSLGDGTGRFVAARSPAVGERVAVADFNGDGQADLAVGHQESISVLLGNGSGRFATARKIATAEGFLTAADFNGDGTADLAVAGKMLVILLSDGAGNLSRAPGPHVKGDFRTSLATADVNGDGRIDITVGQDESLVTLLGDGTGRFHRVLASPRLPFFPRVVAATDLNGDEKVDVATNAMVYDDYHGDVAEEGASRIVLLLQASSTPRPSVSSGHALPHVHDAQLALRGAIVRLAADGDRAAVMATGGRGGTCTLGYRVVVWNAATRKTTNIERLPAPRCSPCCPGDISAYVEQFAVGGDSVAWITESEAGNTQGWHDVFAVNFPAGKVRRIAGVSGRAIYDAIGNWTGHLLGGGSLLAYNEWSTDCEPPPGYMCTSGDIRLQVDGTSLVRIGAGGRTVIKRGAGSYRLSAVGGGRMAVESADGTITVLARSGARVAGVPANGDLALSVALSSTRLAVVRWSGTLDLYNARTGRKLRSLQLAAAVPTELAGLNQRLGLLRRSGHLVLIRLSDGRLISLDHPPRLAGAALTARGLFYAFNVPHAGGRIVFERNATLLRRF